MTQHTYMYHHIHSLVKSTLLWNVLWVPPWFQSLLSLSKVTIILNFVFAFPCPYFFRLYWGTNKIVRYLKCITWFDTHTLWKIPSMKLINTPITSHMYLFLCEPCPYFLLSFTTVFWRYNSHTVQQTHLNCTTEWFLVHSQSCVTISQ